jgi:hypothetical protein
VSRSIITLKSFADLASATARKGKVVPPPDVFDAEKLLYGRIAGDNKYGYVECPTCGKPPTTVPQPIDVHDNDAPKSFLFKDEISAVEYGISGMCQACQDVAFAPTEE